MEINVLVIIKIIYDRLKLGGREANTKRPPHLLIERCGRQLAYSDRKLKGQRTVSPGVGEWETLLKSTETSGSDVAGVG